MHVPDPSLLVVCHRKKERAVLASCREIAWLGPKSELEFLIGNRIIADLSSHPRHINMRHRIIGIRPRGLFEGGCRGHFVAPLIRLNALRQDGGAPTATEHHPHPEGHGEKTNNSDHENEVSAFGARRPHHGFQARRRRRDSRRRRDGFSGRGSSRRVRRWWWRRSGRPRAILRRRSGIASFHQARIQLQKRRSCGVYVGVGGLVLCPGQLLMHRQECDERVGLVKGQQLTGSRVTDQCLSGEWRIAYKRAKRGFRRAPNLD